MAVSGLHAGQEPKPQRQPGFLCPVPQAAGEQGLPFQLRQDQSDGSKTGRGLSLRRSVGHALQACRRYGGLNLIPPRAAGMVAPGGAATNSPFAETPPPLPSARRRAQEGGGEIVARAMLNWSAPPPTPR